MCVRMPNNKRKLANKNFMNESVESQQEQAAAALQKSQLAENHNHTL